MNEENKKFYTKCFYKGLAAGRILADSIEDEKTTYEFQLRRSQALIALVNDFKAGGSPVVHLKLDGEDRDMKVLDITKTEITLEQA
jgi:hypothetical protein